MNRCIATLCAALAATPEALLPRFAQLGRRFGRQLLRERQDTRRLAAIAGQLRLLLFKRPRKSDSFTRLAHCWQSLKAVQRRAAQVENLRQVEFAVGLVRVVNPNQQRIIRPLLD